MEGQFFIKGNNVFDMTKFNESDVLGKTNIYEVIRIIDGVALFEEDHLDRMKKSLDLADYSGYITMDMVKNELIKIITINNNVNGNVKIVINKEMDELSLYYIPHKYPTEEMYRQGVDTVLYHGERNTPNAKIIDNNFGQNIKEVIEKNNVYEAILVDREGNITEGSKSNIFMVKDEVLITSPVSKVLPGVTRGEIIALAKELNINVQEENIHFDQIKDLDGLFISGTSPKILPIRKVDNINFKSTNNVIINNLITNFNKKINNYIQWKREL